MFLTIHGRFPLLSCGEISQKAGGFFHLTEFSWHVGKFLDDDNFKAEMVQLVKIGKCASSIWSLDGASRRVAVRS